MYNRTRLIFVFLVETGFCYVGQADLELLGSSDLSPSAYQCVGIIGMSHHAWHLIPDLENPLAGGNVQPLLRIPRLDLEFLEP